MDEATAIIIRQLQSDSSDCRTSMAKLWTEHRELTATVQGAQGDNGLRSDVRALEEWRAKVEQHLTSLGSRLQHYLDVEREKTCHGKAALKRHEEEREEACEEETEVKTTKMQVNGQVIVSIITLLGVWAMAAATFLGGPR